MTPGPASLALAAVAIDKLELPSRKPVVTLTLCTRLVGSIVEWLQVGWALAGEDLREQLHRADLKIELTSYTLSLPGPGGGPFVTYYPERISRFRLEKPPEGETAWLTFRVELSASSGDHARVLELVEFHLKTIGSDFACSITPRQGDLFEGGSRVDMAPPAPHAPSGPPPPSRPLLLQRR